MRWQRAQEYAQKLAFDAISYPEFRRSIKQCSDDVLREGRRTTKRDRDLILSALEAGSLTFLEIAEGTLLPYQTVYKLLKKMPLVALVKFTEIRPIREPGRGGRRRKEILVSLLHLAQ